ncbi:hypothetical protein [Campylobacter sp.]|uniref:hypothetical protein n=1 Tax=Campylobacter sp. TaxID=205 RepID=UPI0026DCDB33|nr:hypothetical protein [Campylobacter sp.]MDO4674391.1 hypothetical protein [Campylobacter sp.]
MQVNIYSNVASIMQVSNKRAETSSAQTANLQSANLKDEDTLKKLSSLGGKGMTQLYFMEFAKQSMSVVSSNANAQSGLWESFNDAELASSLLSKIDFAALGYQGKNPLSMNKEELDFLISEKGFFGVGNTAKRIADFVVQGAGEDPEKLKKGFEGMKRGFEQAKNLWGGKLPQISQDTINQAIESVSKRIDELGGKTLNLQA